ncbi:MAG: cytochrome c biogenesis protein CcdC [Gemmatimonadales bacterium]
MPLPRPVASLAVAVSRRPEFVCVLTVSVQDLYLRYESVLRPLLRIGPVFGGIVLLAWRVRETRVPVTRGAILIPPLAMSSAFFMFLSPATRVPWSWAITAFLAGLLFLSWPLVRSSRLEVRDGVVYMKRSRAFLAILLGLLAIRLLLHDYIGHLISPLQTASLFYLLAFGMIVRWRAGMYFQYRALRPDRPTS